ncbi:MAG: hypothetical protein FJY47_04585 [Betaproteobacteria bacterium]|nr:hypothetical protein [Betaproteobacteria bacterium]
MPEIATPTTPIQSDEKPATAPGSKLLRGLVGAIAVVMSLYHCTSPASARPRRSSSAART